MKFKETQCFYTNVFFRSFVNFYFFLHYLLLNMPLHMETWNHRNIEWFRLEATFQDHLVQAPCHGHEYLSQDQVA